VIVDEVLTTEELAVAGEVSTLDTLEIVDVE